MRWPLVAGAGVSLAALAWLVSYDGGSSASAAATPPQPAAVGGAWVALGGDAVDLKPGVRYRGCVRYSFVSPLNLLSLARVQSALEAAGFTAVRVLSGSSPPNWPSTSCDWYVDATWSGAAKRMDRPAQVEFAWMWVPS